jgi:hypothetical protein
MSASVVLALPDALRVELLCNPTLRRRWLDAIAAIPSLTLLDWEAWKVRAGDTLVCLSLDLAVAELVLKLPADVRVACARAPRRLADRLRSRTARCVFRERAATRVTHWLDRQPGGSASPERWLGAFLAPVLGSAR